MAALVLLASLSGCQGAPPRAAAADPVAAEQLQRLGLARLLDGDHVGALAAFDEALARGATDVGAYYGAAVALSHLGRREEAVATLLWVARHGPPDRAEVRIARQWLEREGVRTADRLMSWKAPGSP
jgi:tetratricopeptide (TPR) repeat protein